MANQLTAHIDEALIAAGLRRTPQRIALLGYLLRHPDHATVDELWPALNKRRVCASRATVYNNLRSLAKAGLVREVMSEGKAARFDANLRRHHHFVCEHCSAVEDILWFDLPPSVGRASLAGRDVSDYEIVFRGACVRCRNSRPKRGAKL